MTVFEKVRLREAEDEDEDDEREVLRNWESIRVPMMLMDAEASMRRHHLHDEIRAICAAPGLHDGLGNPAGYKPGFVFGGHSDAARKSVEDAYREYVERISNAWRGPPPQGTGADSRRIPVSDQSSDPRAAAYADYCNFIANAWRNGR